MRINLEKRKKILLYCSRGLLVSQKKMVNICIHRDEKTFTLVSSQPINQPLPGHPTISVSFVILNKSFNFSKLQLEKWGNLKENRFMLG